jgi:hypothetical protein
MEHGNSPEAFSGGYGCGILLAYKVGRMARVHTLDTQPGPLPEIRATNEGVTFTITPHGVRPSAVLVIRCSATGDVLVSIRKPQ